MAIKRKDFQKTSSIILEFLLKLPDEETSARLRDTLLHGLHFLQQYYLILQKRDKEQTPLLCTIERGLSPLTPFREAPDKFEWPWIDVESNKVKQTITKHSLNATINLSPIIVAVREGDLRYVKELLTSKPDLVDCVDAFGRDLLTYAVQYQKTHILRYLLSECQLSTRINAQANDGSTCLHRACYSDETQQCDVEIVRLLLENNADVSKQDVHSRSALHWAILAESVDCLKLLLDYDIDPHVKDADGMTPAMWACHLDRHEHFKELSRNMKDELETDNDGRTWIHHSVRKTEPLECLKALLSPNSMQLRDKEGRSCLHVAAEQGSVHACRLIFHVSDRTQNTSYVHDRDQYRQTPLHLATKNGHARVLKELLDHGADPYLQDSHGISAFDYAQNRGLYFCRSVFEVYSRDKRGESTDRTTLINSSMNNNDHRMSVHSTEVIPTPPVNGRAHFVRHNNRRSMTESLPQPMSSSPAQSMEALSRTTTYPNNSSSRHNDRDERDEDNNDESANRRRPRPPSSSMSGSMPAPPIKPRKSSNTPTSVTSQSSRFQTNHHQHYDRESTTGMQVADDDDDDEPNSLEGHGGHSDVEDNQSTRIERPNSRLALHHGDEPAQSSYNAVLRRPHHKPAKHTNRHSMYDDYRFLDDQPRHTSAMIKSKPPSHPSATNKEFPNPSANRIGSSSGNQSATNRLRSGSKSSSNESIPALDLTVAGHKVFRMKDQADVYQSNILPTTNSMRPPSGRLKPLNSAKSTSSFNEDLSFNSTKTLEDVTNNGKVRSPTPTRPHLYRKKLAPLNNSNEVVNKKISFRSSIESPSYVVDDVLSDRSEESYSATSPGGENRRGTGGGREFRSSTGSDKRSKYQ